VNPLSTLTEASEEETAASLAAIVQILPTIFSVLLVIAAALYVLSSWALGKVFAKAGEDSIKAWVPIYNTIIMFRMGNQNPLWLLVMFAPIINFIAFIFMGGEEAPIVWSLITSFLPIVNIIPAIFAIIAVHVINGKFGRGAGSTVLYLFFPFVWSLIIGLGPDRWRERPVTS
jgi:hypothetical protein